jgi:formamidopyrimidine-DNA glycosylase
MPEIPDVEIYKRYIDATSLHRRVARAMVRDTRLLECSPSTLRRHLQGHRLTETRRHGKYLFAHLEHGPWLLLHFGMTGRPIAWEAGSEEPDFVQLRLDFDDGRHLAYRNTRKLGTLGIVDEPETTIREHDLGPDALELDLDGFRERLEGRRGALKPTLMNQTVIAGLGNVWTDEILFQARLHPETPVADLDTATERKLFKTMRRVVSEAIGFKADPDRAPPRYLLRRREPGARCPGRCSGEVEKITVSGRAGYYCPRCQSRGG